MTPNRIPTTMYKSSEKGLSDYAMHTATTITTIQDVSGTHNDATTRGTVQQSSQGMHCESNFHPKSNRQTTQKSLQNKKTTSHSSTTDPISHATT